MSPSSATPNAAIAVQDLHVSLQRHPVLVGVRWELQPGAIAAVFGPTASGKSTLLAAIAGAVAPSGGSVRVLGHDPAAADTKRLIGYMPQVGGLYRDLSVEENLRIFGAAAGVRVALEDQVEKTLELLELRQRRKALIADLAAGHQARVSLGAALLPQAPVLLLDEPLAFADPAFTERLWAHLKSLAEQGRSIVIATSHPTVAARAPRLLVLRAGRVATQGETAALAPVGKASIRLSYREKTGPLVREVQVEDYRQELPNMVHGQVAKPAAIEVMAETVETQLARLLTEDSAHAGLRAH